MTRNFDQAFAEYGGAIDVDLLDISENSIQILMICIDVCRDFIEENIKDIDINLEFGIIMNHNVGAAVTKRDNTYYIGVFYGSYIVLRYLYNLLLSKRSILTSFGSHELENNQDNMSNMNIDNIYALADEVKNVEPVIPKCQIRKGLADLLLKNSIAFLVAHELGHIVNGHYDYYSQTNSIINWKETTPFQVKNGKIPALYLQVLEYDADSYATIKSFKWTIKQHLNAVKARFNLKEGEKLKIEHTMAVDVRRAISLNNSMDSDFDYSSYNQKDALYLWKYSVSLLMRISYSCNYDESKLLSYSHPPAGIRNYLIGATIAAILLNNKLRDNNHKYEILLDYILNAEAEVEDGFRILSKDGSGGKQSNAIRFALNNNKHIIKLENIWGEVRPLIEGYSRVGLAVVQDKPLKALNYNIPYV